MSILIGAFILGALLLGLVAAIVAIVQPSIRVAAILIALLSLGSAGLGLGIFVLAVARMS